MEASYWHQRWDRGEIGFHADQVNPALVQHLGKLNLEPGGRIFVPLCGKSLDIGWLLAQDYNVVGVELSPIAVSELFESLGVEPEIHEAGGRVRCAAPNLEIWNGDFFDLSRDDLGAIDAVYDRAALVALPASMRPRYAKHLIDITDAAPQLLLTYEYDQQLLDGPPFSVPEEEVHRFYDETYRPTLLDRQAMPGKFKGQVVARNAVWLLDGGVQPSG